MTSASFIRKVSVALVSSASLAVPTLYAFAVELNTGTIAVNTTPLKSVLDVVLVVFNNFILPVLLAVVIIVLIVAAFQFAMAGGDAEARTAARGKIVWGLIGLVVLLLMYGIVRIVIQSFATVPGGAIPAPTPIVF